jgi:hypothetical protein
LRRSGTTATTAGSGVPASSPDISEGTGSDISGCDAQHLMVSRPDAASNGTFDESEAYMSSRCAHVAAMNIMFEFMPTLCMPHMPYPH